MTTQSVTKTQHAKDGWVVAGQSFNGVGRHTGIQGVYSVGNLGAIPVFTQECAPKSFGTYFIIEDYKCVDGNHYFLPIKVGKSGQRRMAFVRNGFIVATAFNTRSIIRAASRKIRNTQ